MSDAAVQAVPPPKKRGRPQKGEGGGLRAELIEKSAELFRIKGYDSTTVRDIAAATAFYRDTLRLPLLFEVPNLSFFDVGGVRLMLSTGGEPGGRGTLIYLKVSDIAALHAALAQAGVTFEQTPHVVGKTPNAEVWLAILHDPDGNPIGLMSESPLPA